MKPWMVRKDEPRDQIIKGNKPEIKESGQCVGATRCKDSAQAQKGKRREHSSVVTSHLLKSFCFAIKHFPMVRSLDCIFKMQLNVQFSEFKNPAASTRLNFQ